MEQMKFAKKRYRIEYNSSRPLQATERLVHFDSTARLAFLRSVYS